MSGRINLANMCKGKLYEVSGFTQAASSYTEKLIKMGFVIGTPIELAPVRLTDPLVVQIRGSRIALRKGEAQNVIVKEL